MVRTLLITVTILSITQVNCWLARPPQNHFTNIKTQISFLHSTEISKVKYPYRTELDAKKKKGPKGAAQAALKALEVIEAQEQEEMQNIEVKTPEPQSAGKSAKNAKAAAVGAIEALEAAEAAATLSDETEIVEEPKVTKKSKKKKSKKKNGQTIVESGEETKSVSNVTPSEIVAEATLTPEIESADSDDTEVSSESSETLEERMRRTRPPSRVRITESAQPGFVSLRLEDVGIVFRNQEVLKGATWEVRDVPFQKFLHLSSW